MNSSIPMSINPCVLQSKNESIRDSGEKARNLVGVRCIGLDAYNAS